MKRFQNKAAESRRALPVAIVLGTGVWLLAGVIHQQWWIQLACLLLSTAVMTELDNNNAFIRIYSRMVPVAFVLLSCAATFLFPSMPGGIFQLCLVTSLYTLFRCYQDQQAAGWTFYTFLLLSLGSLAQAQALWFVPVMWLLMATTIYCFSWRTFAASLLGLLCPYWFAMAGILVGNQGDFAPLTTHLGQLAHYPLPDGQHWLQMPQLLTFALVTVLTVTGIIHFTHNSFHDKIRTRQLYYSMMMLYAAATLAVCLQPQHADMMLRVMIVTGSPFIGHFIALTHTRITNIAFCVIIGALALLTAFNLWMSS